MSPMTVMLSVRLRWFGSLSPSDSATHDGHRPRYYLAEVLLRDLALAVEVVFYHPDVVQACVRRAYASPCPGTCARGTAAGTAGPGRC